MFICKECGHIFEKGEEQTWIEPHGEHLSGCQICSGSYEEAEQCNICGSYFLAEKLHGYTSSRVCDNCLNERRNDYEMCKRISFGAAEKVELDSLLVSLFDVSEIEQILREHINSKWQTVDCSLFIERDVDWFCERLVGEVKKDENKKN